MKRGKKMKQPKVIENERLMSEWDWETNKKEGLDPNVLTCGSIKKANWRCSKGHLYKSIIRDRKSGCGCPICSNKLIIPGINDLKTLYPKLADEWDYDKNCDLTPNTIGPGSSRKAHWKCEKGHEWYTSIYSRTNNGKIRKCPTCINQKILKGYNDLGSLYPNIAKEFNEEKNRISVYEVGAGASKSYWWTCLTCGHEWKASISNRIGHKSKRGTGCPQCAKELQTSFPEQCIYYYVKKIFPDAINGYKDLEHGITELDIYIPSLKIGIEYDGSNWHNNELSLQKDNKKDELCKNSGIQLYRFRDKVLSKTKYAIIINCKDGYNAELEKAILKLLDLLRIKKIPDVNIDRDSGKILSLYKRNIKENSLLIQHPEIAKEFHPTKNGNLRPEYICWGSCKKIWWLCSVCGHEWMSTPNKRTNNRGCPKCGRKHANRANSIQVINLDTKKTFNSLGLAARSCGGKPENISKCCNGKIKTAYGYHWQYLDEGKRRQKPYKGKVVNLDTGQIFNSAKEAALIYGLKEGKSIIQCCKRKNKTSGGYHWAYYDEQ